MNCEYFVIVIVLVIIHIAINTEQLRVNSLKRTTTTTTTFRVTDRQTNGRSDVYRDRPRHFATKTTKHRLHINARATLDLVIPNEMHPQCFHVSVEG